MSVLSPDGTAPISSDLADLRLRTLFTFSGRGHLLRTREMRSTPAPRLFIVRTLDSVAWATRIDAPDEVARLAATERSPAALSDPVMHERSYLRLLRAPIAGGPAFLFPDEPETDATAMRIDDHAALGGHFDPDEIQTCSPIMAVVRDGTAVSFCHCSRSTPRAAEAGVFTAPAHRGRGLATRATAAWASAVRAEGRVPIYSTSWDNAASLAVARKLGLMMAASDLSIA